MSTRGLWGFIQGENYTANYKHSDAYPSGLGAEFWSACKTGELGGYGIEEESIDFIRDSLFCEWAYFYDRDTGVFEIWKGFQKVPDPQNPFGQEKDDDGYYPCRRIFQGPVELLSFDIFEETGDIERKLVEINRHQKLTTILK